MALPVAQSKITISQSVELAGQTTSQLQVSPLGIPKLRIASWLVHTLVTVAELQAGSVVVVHTVIVAAAQSCQSCPSSHGSHLAHCGIVKSNIAALDVQELVTLADVPAAQVVVLPTVIVAAVQSSQSFQGVPGVQGSHFRFLY